MKTIIYEKLREIEEKEAVRILYATESGSRAWGFASPDSDYDVRFIYLRKAEDYLRVKRPRDVIEWQLDETLDINGWDLQKALRLLARSNPTLFEWASSPIVYQSTPEWEQLRPMIHQFFSSKRGMYHYLSMAKNNYVAFLQGEEVIMKKYLYALRPILACKWILQRGTPPPMAFDALVEAQLETAIKPAVALLLEKKMACAESGTIPKHALLNQYIVENIAHLSAQVKALEDSDPVDWEMLEGIFAGLLRT